MPNGARGRHMGLDVGDRRIGVALSDETATLASALTTVTRTGGRKDAGAVADLVRHHEVAAVVVGLPLNMDGSDGPSAQSARAFARNWAARSLLPLVMQDERLSTSAVTRTLLEADTSRRRRDDVVDKMAAAYILQGALDRLRNLR